jgi:hypothetical protein
MTTQIDVTIGNGFVHDIKYKGRPMLEQTSWIPISKQCHTLVDEDFKVLAYVFTKYSESDGDENLVWDVEIEDEAQGSYVSLYCAKMAVQKAIAAWDAKKAAAKEKKKKVVETKKKEKKSVARK